MLLVFVDFSIGASGRCSSCGKKNKKIKRSQMSIFKGTMLMTENIAYSPPALGSVVDPDKIFEIPSNFVHSLLHKIYISLTQFNTRLRALIKVRTQFVGLI